jgi:hypothetical protein
MADKSGMAEIRGINIRELAIAYEDQALIFKKYCAQATTANREIRYWDKTAGYLTQTAPGITSNVPELARPYQLEQSWNRHITYVRNYKVDSPWISDEDIKDSPVAVLASNIRDIANAVAYQVDARIWDVITESRSVSTINTNSAAAAWDTASYTNVNIVEDLMEAKQNIYVNSGFSPEGAILFLSPKDHRSMINWLIDGKGSSIPSFSSQRIVDGVVMEILGLKVVVSTQVTADYACVMIPQIAVTWYSFMPIQTAIIDEPLIGKKIRAVEEGEATLDRPKCVNLITNTQT